MIDDGSFEVLETLCNYNDFMRQLEVIADMGSGAGHHSKWWASMRDEDDKPLNYQILAVDNDVQLDNRNRMKNVRQIRQDFSATSIQENKVDVIWCHNSFQYAIDPFATLTHWHKILTPSGMLIISIPQFNYIDDLSRWQMYQPSGCYYSWNIVTLIQALAVSGFDCRDGFFRQRRHDQFIWAAVYKSQHAPMDRATTTWYDLAEKNLLPVTAQACVEKIGMVRQEFLTVEWLDHNRYDLAVESLP